MPTPKEVTAEMDRLWREMSKYCLDEENAFCDDKFHYLSGAILALRWASDREDETPFEHMEQEPMYQERGN